MKAFSLTSAAALALGTAVYYFSSTDSFAYSQETKEPASDNQWVQDFPQHFAENWYSLSQGSQLIAKPLWDFMATPDGGGYSAAENLISYGLIWENERDLPIGLVVDHDDERGDFVGLSCAACHTKAVYHDEDVFLVHGAGGWFNYSDFYLDMIANVQSIAGDDERLLAYADASEQSESEARAELLSWLSEHEKLSSPILPSTNWGFGRMDALGQIVARTNFLLNGEDFTLKYFSNAPVDYPQIWNTNQQAVLEYHGEVQNGKDLGITNVTKSGAFTRNLTEVTGTFAFYDISADGDVLESSVRVKNLFSLEAAIGELPSPKWPEALGPIDEQLASQGEAIFYQECQSCHGQIAADDVESEFELVSLEASMTTTADGPINVVMPAIGKSDTRILKKMGAPREAELLDTDPMMTCNTFGIRLPSGVLAGKERQFTIDPLDHEPLIEDEESIIYLLSTLVQKMLKGPKLTESVGSYFQHQVAGLWPYSIAPYSSSLKPSSVPPSDETLNPLERVRADCAEKWLEARQVDPSLAAPGYKSRTLNGIWATGPYLHNGSVPTIYDLLQTQENRPREISYGKRFQLDTKKLGALPQTGDETQIFQVYDDQGEIIPGNWNGGHEYGSALSDDEKWALIEYLKTI